MKKQTPKKQKLQYTLEDTFNKRTLSRHRSIAAAVAAMDRHARKIERECGRGQHVSYAITDRDGRDILHPAPELQIDTP